MELAKAAELNSYPGPAHAIELAVELALTPAQVARLSAVQASMASEAKALGAEIVEKERALDRAFGERTVDAEAIRTLSLAIAELRGRLRAVHLQAHLDTTAALTAQQVHRYDVLRGYADAGGHQPDRSHTGRNGRH